MLLPKSLIFVMIFHITVSNSHPLSAKELQKRIKRTKQVQLKVGKKDDGCVKGFCEEDPSYPLKEIKKLLKENQLPLFYMKSYEEPKARDHMREEHHICDIISKTMHPKRADNGFGDKEVIIQTNSARQSIHLEVCQSLQPKLINNSDCLPLGHDVFCQQQYRIIPLWTYNERNKTLNNNQFKVPSACTVHYNQKKHRELGQSQIIWKPGSSLPIVCPYRDHLEFAKKVVLQHWEWNLPPA